ncbi:MAG: type III pantothenate kinase [Acidimicrobiaceae bacterium]|nr:type III pantothenate kinase [Acidimicrobiaceae bacterium]
MLLAIDVGNTQTVFGLYDLSSVETGDGSVKGGRKANFGLSHNFRIATVSDRTADEHALLFSQLLGMRGLDRLGSISGLVLSSTVPSLTTALRDMFDRWFQVEAVVVAPGIRSGMAILYDSPKEVGADRIADAVAAYDLYPGPCVVVDFGTATTFDAVSGNKEYLGGAIVPGIEISLNALFANAAALRKVELTEPRGVIGKSTVESIQSGALYGFAEQADGLCRRFKAELGGATTVIATGGLSSLISRYCNEIDVVEPWLTLHGLRLIYEMNTPARG